MDLGNNLNTMTIHLLVLEVHTGERKQIHIHSLVPDHNQNFLIVGSNLHAKFHQNQLIWWICYLDLLL